MARAAIAGAHARGKRILVTGGSGFYLAAFFGPVSDDLPIGEAVIETVRTLQARGPEAVLAELRALEGAALPDWLAEHRRCDQKSKAEGLSPKSLWQLAGAGAVGAQSLLGMPILHRLKAALGADCAVWPFDPIEGKAIVIAEIYAAFIGPDVKALEARGKIRDAAEVELLSAALWNLAQSDRLAPLFQIDAATEILREEGWTLGTGHGPTLRAAIPASQLPPRLRDDCFAMPQGVAWVPVDEALERLKAALAPVTGTEALQTNIACGRILAADCIARRSNPPRPNSAVDGYGFAHAATKAGVNRLPLVAGRAAAGQPFEGTVPPGHAVRILTGAILPEGVDTVVLEEDCATDSASVTFDGPAKPRANTRKAGEDVVEGAVALKAGQRLRAPDLALLSALGIAEATVHRPLRVGVLSTGDEIIATPDKPALPHQIYDANRPMLLALARQWGHTAVDLGHAPDRPSMITRKLDRAAREVDVVLTSGGASAGDEDHVSRLLREEGTLSSWRIAMKPGRPLALALWQGVPVFGLPGNPVAALVCALIFARPALSLMAGASFIAAPAQAVDDLRIIAPAKPGGGWDQTARMIENAMRGAKRLCNLMGDATDAELLDQALLGEFIARWDRLPRRGERQAFGRDDTGLWSRGAARDAGIACWCTRDGLDSAPKLSAGHMWLRDEPAPKPESAALARASLLRSRAG